MEKLMFTKPCLILTTLAAMAFTPVAARAQDSDALLDLLVKKKIVTEKEAASLRADLEKQKTATGAPVPSDATKLKLSTPLTELELYGDARVRYEVRNGQTAAPDPINPPGDTYQRNRARYRLRLGLKGTLMDDWFFGVRLETSSNPRSTNITFGDDTSAGPGPFAKNSDTISVGQAYFGYKGLPGLTLTAGKMPNPFVTSSMVWDGDINPEGLAEQYKYTIKLAAGSTATGAETTTDKDGKTMVTEIGSPAFVPTLDLFANFGQFVYDDSNPENPVGPAPSGVPDTDAYLLGWQVGAKYTFSPGMSLQIAPTLYNYTGNGNTFNRHFSGDPTFSTTDPVTGAVTTTTPNQTGINSLLVLEVPAEFAFKIGKLPARVFGDFAYNFEGDERARAAGHPEKTDQNLAYQIGVGIGGTKRKGDISLTAFWQHAEQYALDPNLVDSDVYDSRVNIEGALVQIGYAITDAVTANLTYAHGWQIDRDLGTGGVGDVGINPVNDYNLLQADLSFKF
jgi:hypothetical protein